MSYTLAQVNEAIRLERERCAKIADEFNRPGPRAPSDLGDDENGIWNNCAARIGECIRAQVYP
jgi:hypothetical protein